MSKVPCNFSLKHFYNGGVDSERGTTRVGASLGLQNGVLQLEPLELIDG